MTHRKAIVRSLPVLIFDFDGTVSLGDGPVLAYAAAVAAEAGAGPDFVAEVEARLGREYSEWVDDYDAVRGVAIERGVDDAALSRAYLASRAGLATPTAPVVAPAGLADFLAGVGAERRAERILLTNAPAIRLREALGALGLPEAFDRILTDAGKPTGLEALLDSLSPDRRVLSVGDVWRNDLAPAHARGQATALVGARPQAGAEPDLVGATVTDVLPGITRWLDDSA